MEWMDGGEFVLRRAVVCASGLIYWGGVFLQARRVRKKIGRTPNLTPKDTKEKLLWAGWVAVVAGWIGQPLLVGGPDVAPLQLIPNLTHPVTVLPGILLIVAGYAGTLWCYAAMGAAWRIGIDKGGSSSLVQNGPYQWMRHPIYSFQMVMLLGALLLLPTLISFGILALHYLCASIKAKDEEIHLGGVFGAEYAGYRQRTGRFAPKW
jgi:protein-S-isoprenylcysteine O-methyltransferase Ste14